MQISGGFLEQIAALKGGGSAAGQAGLQGLFASLLMNQGSEMPAFGTGLGAGLDLPQGLQTLLDGGHTKVSGEGLLGLGFVADDVGSTDDIAGHLRQLVADMQALADEILAQQTFAGADLTQLDANGVSNGQALQQRAVTVVQQVTVTIIAFQVQQQSSEISQVDQLTSLQDVLDLMTEAGFSAKDAAAATENMALLLQYAQTGNSKRTAQLAEQSDLSVHRLLEASRASTSHTSFTLAVHRQTQVQFQVGAQALQQAQLVAPVQDAGVQAELGRPLLPVASNLNEEMHMNAMLNAQAAGRITSGLSPAEDAAMPAPQVKRAGKEAPDAKQPDRPVTELIQLRGQEIFRWQQTQTGMDVMQQMKDVQAMMAQAGYSSAGGDATGDMAVQDAEAGTSARGSSFAERVMQFAKAANVGLQAKPMMQTLAQNGGGTVKVQLHPAELGSIQIELEVREGSVRGRIAAENIEVIEHLARDMHHLKQGLAEAGYELGEDGISFMLSDDNTKDQPQGQQAQADAQNTEASAEENPADWVNPDQLLDVKV